jgi:hypothetical protein
MAGDLVKLPGGVRQAPSRANTTGSPSTRFAAPPQQASAAVRRPTHGTRLASGGSGVPGAGGETLHPASSAGCTAPLMALRKAGAVSAAVAAAPYLMSPVAEPDRWLGG